MSRRARLGLFACAGPGLAAVLVLGFRRLPHFGAYHGVYGLVVSGVELGERHATDLVTALNFDLRAFDTLGEEFILFAAVIGVALLLRELRGDAPSGSEQAAGEHRFGDASEALRAATLLLLALLLGLGWYLVLHGALTPGGGFQGGVVLAAGPIAALLAGRYLALKRVAPEAVLDALDSLGAASYALLGLGGLVLGGVYLKNFIALGIPGHLLSAGFMPLNSVAVGLEVTGAFLLAWTEFLDQALITGAAGGQP